MISNETKKIIDVFVDEYIDETRLDIFYLKRDRAIEETNLGKFIVTDSDVIIDWSQGFKKILQHPIEDFFIPDRIELFVVEYEIQLELPELINLANFDVVGISYEEEILISNYEFKDEDLKRLLSHTCFDKEYQKSYPEVTEYLKEVYGTEHDVNAQAFLDRIRPVLNV